jgi:hypothetical protein
MQDCKTPAPVHFKKDCLSAGESSSEEDTQRYQSIIGSLMYAMIGTRPDIAFVLSDLSKYLSRPGKNHLVAGEIILVYLQFSKDYHLEFCRGTATENYPCMAIVMLHGAVRKMVLQLQLLFSKF